MVFVIVLLLCFMIIIYVWYSSYNEVFYVVSDIDGNSYAIRRGKQKSQEYLKNSANTLAEINKRIHMLIGCLVNKYEGTDHYFFVKRLKDTYTHNILSEAAYDPRYTTYTVDKQHMHICLRTRDPQELTYDINLLMYVILHELAHFCNYTPSGVAIQGHGPEFMNIFRVFVQEAVKCGIYKYENYRQTPKEYCGMYISSSVL